MTAQQREAAYLRQTGKARLTPRQRRRVDHKANRDRRPAANGPGCPPPPPPPPPGKGSPPPPPPPPGK